MDGHFHQPSQTVNSILLLEYLIPTNHKKDKLSCKFNLSGIWAYHEWPHEGGQGGRHGARQWFDNQCVTENCTRLCLPFIVRKLLSQFTAVRLHVYLVFVKSIEQELKIQ